MRTITEKMKSALSEAKAYGQVDSRFHNDRALRSLEHRGLLHFEGVMIDRAFFFLKFSITEKGRYFSA